VTCVYTPPERRGRRYGGAITAATCADALARDAERVVLFTDADNPAPNVVYERIGFRPVADHRVVRFR
jgi:predicted GNAT family acetyltransferase